MSKYCFPTQIKIKTGIQSGRGYAYQHTSVVFIWVLYLHINKQRQNMNDIYASYLYVVSFVLSLREQLALVNKKDEICRTDKQCQTRYFITKNKRRLRF